MFKELFSRKEHSSFADFCRDLAKGKAGPKQDKSSPDAMPEWIALSICAGSSTLYDRLTSSKELKLGFQSRDKDFIVFITASFLVARIRRYINGAPFSAAQPDHIQSLMKGAALQAQSVFVDRFCGIKSLTQRRGEVLTRFNEMTFDFMQDASVPGHEKLVDILSSIVDKNSDILSTSHLLFNMEVMAFCTNHVVAQYEIIDNFCAGLIKSEVGVMAPQDTKAQSQRPKPDPLDNLRSLAASGDATAQWRLGRMYFEGDGVEKDYSAALAFLRPSAEVGNPNSQGLVGIAYNLGLGVAVDFNEAEKWLLKAAKQGSDAAAFFLGKLYMEGKGAEHSPQNAALWMERSAALGNNGAQGVMAEMCFSGMGVVSNPKQAYFWALLAAQDKNPARIELTKTYAAKVTLEEKIEIFKKAKNWKPGDQFIV
jgi:hypothetical protein